GHGHARPARPPLRRRRVSPRQGRAARGRGRGARPGSDPGGGWRRGSTGTAMKYAGLVLANLGRNRLRTALTAGAIMLAVLLVCVLLTMPAGLDAMLNKLASNTRISVHNKAGLVYAMPYAFTRKVRQIDGVEAACAFVWFGGA